MFSTNIDLLRERNPLLALEITTDSDQPLFTPKPLPSIESNILAIYGAHPKVFEDLEHWLASDEKRRLYLFDSHWRAFLDQPMVGSWLTNPQIQYMGAHLEGDANRFAWETLFKRVEVIDGRGSGSVWAEALQRAKDGVELSLSDFKDYGISTLNNVIANLRRSKELYHISQWEGVLEGEVALICGAGPSVKEEIDAIRDIAEGAYVFAGGRALEVAQELDIKADFGAIIDPSFTHPDFAKWTGALKGLFYQDRAAAGMVDRSLAPPIWSGVADGYPLQKWLYREMGIYLPFEGGWNVSNFLIGIAIYLGCKTIILAGLDHCYQDGDKYAIEVAHRENMPLVERNNSRGERVWTKRDFLQSIDWITEVVQNYPDASFYYVGETGIAIDGVAPWSHRVNPIEKRVLEIQGEPISFDFSRLSKSIDSAYKICCELLEIFKRDRQEREREELILSIELKEEICYRHFLRPLWDIWKYSLAIDSDLIQNQPSRVAEARTRLYEYLFYCKCLEKTKGELDVG